MLRKSEGSYKALKKLKQSCELRSLPKVDPHMDKDGLLRVDGRLEFAPVPADKHPVILRYSHHLTKLIIRHHHQIVGHSGIAHTWTSVRKKCWMLKGETAIRKELSLHALLEAESPPRSPKDIGLASSTTKA